MGRLGMGELLVILITALIIFGPKSLPSLGKTLGQTIKNFKDSIGIDEDDKKE